MKINKYKKSKLYGILSNLSAIAFLVIAVVMVYLCTTGYIAVESPLWVLTLYISFSVTLFSGMFFAVPRG
jgi:low affinity Fe/Cu permease